jgi:hypothetical protein
MTRQTTIPDFYEAAPAPTELLMHATFSRSERSWIDDQPDLARELRNADSCEWPGIVEQARRAVRTFQRSTVPDDAKGMRRQALHDLYETTQAYTELTDGRRCELFRLICRLAKYVANRVLQPSELRDAFQDAAGQNGALARYGQRWLDDTLARALETGRNDKLPPLARRFRSERLG